MGKKRKLKDNDYFGCKICKASSLDTHHFSRSQLNKVEYGKITPADLKCISCVLNEQESIGKKRAKIEKSDACVSVLCQSRLDPSVRYLNNPLNAPVIREFRNFFKSLKMVNTEVHIGPATGWRTIAKLAVRSSRADDLVSHQLQIGLFLPGSHDVISCNNSPVHHPSINAVVEALEHSCKLAKTPGYDEATETGLLRYILFGVERKTSKVQLTLVWNALNESSNPKSEKKLKKLLRILTKGDNYALFHSIWVHYHLASKHNNAITGREEGSWRLLYGLPFISEVLDVGIAECSGISPTLRFPPNVFRQANLDSFSTIVKEIRNWIYPSSNCVELYGGVGTIGLHLLDLVHYIKCSDDNPNNKVCFEGSLSELPIEYQRKAEYRSASAAQLAAEGYLRDCDIIIVDPPRKGLDEEVIIALLNRLTPSIHNSSKDKHSNDKLGIPLCRLIYVSCGFKSFCRDCHRLLNGVGAPSNGGMKRYNWSLMHASGYVLFPGSDHIETLAVFDINI